MKIGILFGGQGSQTVGMGKDLCDNFKTFAEAWDKLSDEQKNIAFNGPMEALSKTTNTQPILLAFGMGIFNTLKEVGIKPSMLAGLSLGEYTALCAAEVFSLDEGLELVSYRAKKMEEAAEGIACAMAAVMELDKETLETCCSEASTKESFVEITNINCPGQMVISGEESAVEKASQLALEKGARRVIPLKVSGPFHTRYMKPASLALKERFETTIFSEMKTPVLFNILGRCKRDDETIGNLLEKQVSTGVRMEEIIRNMIDEGIDTFIEISPSKTLATFVKKVSRDVDIYTITNSGDLAKVIEDLKP